MKKSDARKKNPLSPAEGRHSAPPAPGAHSGAAPASVRPSAPAVGISSALSSGSPRPAPPLTNAPPIIAAKNQPLPAKAVAPMLPAANPAPRAALSSAGSSAAPPVQRPTPPAAAGLAATGDKALTGTRPSSAPQAQVVHFELHHPGARSVCLAGTFNNWQPEGTAMAAVGSGKWAKDVSLLPGTYEYRYVVDGQWMEDPQAKKSAPNPFGTWNSVLTVPART